MKYLKLFENFDPYDDEPLSDTEKHFGKQTRLEKQFSKIVVDGLSSEDDNTSRFWSTFNALKSNILDLIDDEDVTYKELMHRIVEGEDPLKVMNDICYNLVFKNITLTPEIKRLLAKLNSIDLDKL